MSGSLQLWGWSVCSQQELEKLHYGCGTFPVCEPEAYSSIWLLPTPGVMSLHPTMTLNMGKSFGCCAQTDYSHISGPQCSLVYGHTYKQFRTSLKCLQDPWYTKGLIASHSSSLQVTGVEAIQLLQIWHLLQKEQKAAICKT